MLARRPRLSPLVLAAGLAWLVLFNTLLVSFHNLGARDDISYINGGKVFRLTGTMWYHLPGLQEVGLAPQNLGGQINLRNNEFALLDRDLRAVERIDVNFHLDTDAMLFIILDRHREGTFWALRLTAFEKEDSPFINALIRYEQGRVVQRIPLPGLGRVLSAGEHSATLELDETGRLTASVGDATETVPFPEKNLNPSLALGCGERNTIIYAWHVVGTDESGNPFDWKEEFSLSASLGRAFTPLVLLTFGLWLLLCVLPTLKVAFESGTSVSRVAEQAFLSPRPRWIFGLFCLIPWAPLGLQWFLGGLYLVYAWMTLWETLAMTPKTWNIRDREATKTHWTWLGIGALGIFLAVTLFFARTHLRDHIVGQEQERSAGTAIEQLRGMHSLQLGPISGDSERPRSELSFTSNDDQPVRITVQTQLQSSEVLRIDLLRDQPPTHTDIYQVDRSQDPRQSHPEDAFQSPSQHESPQTDESAGHGDEQRDDGPEEGEDSAGDYSLRAASVFISCDEALPGQLRWLHDDKVEGSSYGGWTVSPGAHEVTITVDAPLAIVSVDGTIVDFRTDLDDSFRVGALQMLAMSQQVTAVGDVTVENIDRAQLAPIQSRILWSDILGVVGLILLIFGLLTSAVGFGSRIPFSPQSLRQLVRKMGRGHLLFGLWLLWWVLERAGTVDWAGERQQIAIGAITLAIGTFNFAQLLRQSAPERSRWMRAAGALVLLIYAVSAFEGIASMYPERQHNWTHYWHENLGPSYYWVHDPMVRRLNPWFIDQRFKRRDWSTDPDSRTRVVVFGGSQTYGWGIPAMDRMAFSDQLERALHTDGYNDVEVLNAAFPGVKTATGLRWFTGNLLRYNADIVVINFVVNEFMNVDQFHVWSGENTPDETLSPLAIGALVERWRGDLMGNHLSQIIVADVYEIYAMDAYLRWWKDIADQHGIKLIFSIEPTNLYVESGGDSIMRSETQRGAAQDVYRALGEELGVPVFDVLPFFREEQENIWFYDTMHMSRLGHRVFAQNLAKLIEEHYLEP